MAAAASEGAAAARRRLAGVEACARETATARPDLPYLGFDTSSARRLSCMQDGKPSWPNGGDLSAVPPALLLWQPRAGGAFARGLLLGCSWVCGCVCVWVGVSVGGVWVCGCVGVWVCVSVDGVWVCASRGAHGAVSARTPRTYARLEMLGGGAERGEEGGRV